MPSQEILYTIDTETMDRFVEACIQIVEAIESSPFKEMLTGNKSVSNFMFYLGSIHATMQRQRSALPAQNATQS